MENGKKQTRSYRVQIEAGGRAVEVIEVVAYSEKQAAFIGATETNRQGAVDRGSATSG
jgi:hypothetical protein